MSKTVKRRPLNHTTVNRNNAAALKAAKTASIRSAQKHAAQIRKSNRQPLQVNPSPAKKSAGKIAKINLEEIDAMTQAAALSAARKTRTEKQSPAARSAAEKASSEKKETGKADTDKTKVAIASPVFLRTPGSTPGKTSKKTPKKGRPVVKAEKTSSLKGEKAAVIKAEKVQKKTQKKETAESRKAKGAALLSSGPKKIKWSLVIPALAVVLALVMFVVASQAGWIQNFLTPESRRTMAVPVLPETEEETTTTEEETTTTEEETTTPETTTEETTTAFVPSYHVIHVNLAYNRVTIYTRGEKLNDGWDPESPYDDEYDLIPVIAFFCSPGVNQATPTGQYFLKDRAAWCIMYGEVWTQFATRIVDDVMFHSIPYYTQNPGDLETDQYNILGWDASSACIRLCARDAYYIYANCAYDTEVDIFYDWDYPGPLTPEPIYQIPTDIEQLKGWDPTDTYNTDNPWLSYSAFLTNGDVSLPVGSSVTDLLNALGPTDKYGNNLSAHFYTDGGYSLWYAGTYNTTGHIDLANLSFSFPITITVTEAYVDYSYDTGEVTDYSYDTGEVVDYGYNDYSYDTGEVTDYGYDDYSYDTGEAVDYSYDDYSYDTGEVTDYSYDDYSYDTGEVTDYSYDDYSYDTGEVTDYGYDDYSYDTGEVVDYGYDDYSYDTGGY